jgi:hypothetical protein
VYLTLLGWNQWQHNKTKFNGLMPSNDTSIISLIYLKYSVVSPFSPSPTVTSPLFFVAAFGLSFSWLSVQKRKPFRS